MIDGEITAGHVINADRDSFASHLECPFLAPFSSVFHTPELGCRLKSNNVGNRKYVFFAVHLLHLLAVFIVAGKFHFESRLALHKIVIIMDDLHQYKDEPHRKDHQQSDRKFFWPPYL